MTPYTNVRIPQALYSRIKAIAESQAQETGLRRPVQWLIAEVLARWVKEQEKT